MFDSVGRNLDEEARKRQAQTALIMFVFGGVVTGFTLGVGAFTAAKVIIDGGFDDDEMVEVVLEDMTIDETPPPPPPPPPPPAPEEELDEDVDEEEEPTITPDEMLDEVADLEEKVEEKMKSETKPKGVKGGVEGGVEGGVVGGVLGGVVGGEMAGQLGPRVFHHSEVEVKRRVLPRYPEAAKALNLGDVSCKVRVFIDEGGVPYELKFDACPKIFHDSARTAIMKWRWYPAKVNREKVRAQFILNVKYKLK